MSRLRFPSSTSLLIALATAAAPACGSDDCGPGGAPSTGVVASNDQVSMTFGALSGGLNNDCPASDAPAGVISLTIHGTQTDDPAGFLTLCIPRPDLLARQRLNLALDAPGAPATSGELRVVDIDGTAVHCSLALDRAQPATGTASASGLCGNGDDPAGFALVLEGAVSLTRTCGANTDTVSVNLRGRVAVGAD